MAWFEKLAEYFQYSFVWYLLIVGVLVALCSSLLGVTLVLKRFSYLGDGLSHVAFGATAVAAALKLTDRTVIVLPLTVLCAVLLLRLGQNTKVKGDAAIGMISVGALAVGYLLLNVFSVSSNVAGDVCSALFGSTSILTLTLSDVIFSLVLSALVIGVFVFFYHKIFALTFDENFARATGVRVELYNLLIAVVIAVVVVLAMDLIGSLLVSALVIFPALSAMRLFSKFRTVTVAACVFSVLCALVGILLAILLETPVGATVVVCNIFCLALCALIGRFAHRS